MPTREKRRLGAAAGNNASARARKAFVTRGQPAEMCVVRIDGWSAAAAVGWILLFLPRWRIQLGLTPPLLQRRVGWMDGCIGVIFEGGRWGFSVNFGCGEGLVF